MSVELFRKSARELVCELQEALAAGTIRGAIVVFLGKDGGGHFRISGFDDKTDVFTVAGLLDWVKADLMSDLVG